jgi:O-antigen/teichoic acid export membrane protein
LLVSLRQSPEIKATVRHLGRNFAWVFVGAVASRFLALLVIITVGRIANAHELGQVGLLQGFLTTSSTLISAGFGLALTREIAIGQAAKTPRTNTTVGIALATSCVVTLMLTTTCIALSGTIAAVFLTDPTAARYVEWAAIGVFFLNLQAIEIAVLAGLGRFNTIAYLNLTSGLLVAAASITGAYFDGAAGFIKGSAIATAVSSVGWLLIVRGILRAHGIAPRLTGAHGEWKRLLAFSVPATLGALLVEPVNLASTTLLARSPNGLSQAGLYFYVLAWASMINFLPNLTNQAIAPTMAQDFRGGHAGRLARTIALSALFNVTTCAIGSIVVVAAFEWLAPAHYQADPQALWILGLLLLGNAMSCAMNSASQAAVAASAMWRGVVVNIAWALCLLLAEIAMISHGAVALAGARAMAYAISVLGSIWLILTCLRWARSHGAQDAS